MNKLLKVKRINSCNATLTIAQKYGFLYLKTRLVERDVFRLGENHFIWRYLSDNKVAEYFSTGITNCVDRLGDGEEIKIN